MNFSAEIGLSKCPNGSIWRQWGRMVTAAIVVLVVCQSAAAARQRGPFSDLFGESRPKLRGALHATTVPLPRPRPAEAPPPRDATEAKTGSAPSAQPDKPAEQATPEPPKPSACRLALTDDIAIAPSIADINAPGGCGGTDLVRLEAIVLPNKHKVAVTPAATLRCTMASAIADWVRTDVARLAAQQSSEPAVLDNFDSYECRGFNRIAGAHLSEHGRANALDVRAIKLANGTSIGLTDRSVPRDVRESVLHSVCARFMTVLGPDSDWYHEDHIHLDLAERRNNYKICQWDVLDPLPKVAPLLPAERPDEAPPREVAKEDTKGDVAKSDAKDEAKGDAAKQNAPKLKNGRSRAKAK
jgi:hypothetical protein